MNDVPVSQQAAKEEGSLFAAAVAAYDAGQSETAWSLASKVLAVRPGHPRALFMLGNIKLHLGDAVAALSYLERASREAPQAAEIWHALGSAYFSLKRWAEACQAFQNALDRSALDPNLLNQFGLALCELGKAGAAAAAYRKALELKPDDAEIHNHLGIALNLMHDYEGAIAAYRRSTELNPGNAQAWTNLAMLYEQANMLQEAEAAVSRGLELSPQQGQLHLVAARCARRRGVPTVAISRLQEALNMQHLDGSVRRAMEFELGRDYDLLGNAEQAYNHFLEGNRQTFNIWPELAAGAKDYRRELGALRNFFTAFPLNKLPQTKSSDSTARILAFLVGFPRSGTTLMDTMLDAHPDIAVLEEQPFLESLVAELRTHPLGYPGAIATLTAKDLEQMRRRYWQAVDGHLGKQASAAVVIDKNPLLSAHAGFIHILFPQARFIFAMRHPCDVILSCFMQPFGRNPVLANFSTLQGSAATYCSVMSLWQHYRQHFSLQVHELRYEKLVENKEAALRALLNELGLEWRDALLDHTDHARSRGRIYTPSYHQVVQPIYREAINRWRRYAEFLQEIRVIVWPWEEYFGYKLPA